jgi:hypothetical protein
MKGLMAHPVLRLIAVILVVVMGVVSLVSRVDAAPVPSAQSPASLSRHEDLATIQRALEHKLVKKRLRDLGYTEDEVKARLDRLSDSGLHRPATQIEILMPAGGFTADCRESLFMLAGKR